MAISAYSIIQRQKWCLPIFTKTNIAVDGIGVAKNLYTAMSDQYKGMIERMEKRNDNAAD